MQRDDFGPNEWLIEEMYRRYAEDPSSVGEAWQEFFEDYRPSGEEPPPKKEPDEPEEPPPAAGSEGTPLRGVLAGVRGAAPQGPGGQAVTARLRRDHDHRHESRNGRNRAVRAAAAGGAGRDRRRRRHRLPGRVPGRGSGRARRNRRRQGG